MGKLTKAKPARVKAARKPLKGAGKKAVKAGKGRAVAGATWKAAQKVGAFGVNVGDVVGIAKAARGKGGGMPGYRRSKRISPTNVRALRRAASRLSKFQRLSSRVNRMLRKFAPKGARRARSVRRYRRY